MQCDLLRVTETSSCKRAWQQKSLESLILGDPGYLTGWHGRADKAVATEVEIISEVKVEVEIKMIKIIKNYQSTRVTKISDKNLSNSDIC